MQFSLRALFYVVTWAASIAGLAVSRFGGWTVFAVGCSLACLNTSGRLATVQGQPRQRQMFRCSWLLFVASLLLPAVKGCGGSNYQGWQAAMSCGYILAAPMIEDERVVNGWAYCDGCLLTMANLLLACSPLFLWRLRRGKGQCYGVVFALGAAAMWCAAVGDSQNLLIGYYVWRAAGMALLSAYRLHWSALALIGVTPLLTWFAQQTPEASPASPQAVVRTSGVRVESANHRRESPDGPVNNPGR